MAKFKLAHSAYRKGKRFATAGSIVDLKPGQRPGHFWQPLDQAAVDMLKALPPPGQRALDKLKELDLKPDPRSMARLKVRRDRFAKHIAKHEARVKLVVEARKKGEEPPPEEPDEPQGVERGKGGLQADEALSPQPAGKKKRAADEET